MSPAPPPVRWGVLGATAQVAQGAVMPALAASPKCELVAVASRSRPDGGYPTFGAARLLPSYEALLADPEVEAVYLPLPNSLHAEWSVRAAEAGKHVLCEKPLATNAMEASAIASACDAAGVVAMEAYMTPFHPRSALLDDVLRSGRLGELRFARTAFTWVLEDETNHRWSPDFGGGALLDVGIYCLAPLLLAAGRRPVDFAAQSVMTAGGVDSSFTGWLDFGRGFTAVFACSLETPPRQHLEVVGTEATVTVDRAFTPGAGDRAITLVHRDGRTEELQAGGGDSYRGMVDHFSTVLRGGVGLRRTVLDSIELLTLINRLKVVAAGQ